MSTLADSTADVAPLPTAALLLVALPHLERLGLPHPSATKVLAATGAGRSRAYMLKRRLQGLLRDLVRPSGRPPAAQQPLTVASAHNDLSLEVLHYVMRHPGCVHGRGKRRRYSDGFRHLVIELAQRRDLELDTLAERVAVPLATLKPWLRAPTPETEPNAQPPTPDATGPRVESILYAFRHWNGAFIAFCDYVQQQLRISYGRTQIAQILEAYGVRLPRRRRGRSPDEKALRESFETFFPGAQWTADGTPIPFAINGETFLFNLELTVDTASGAFTGASLRDTEDSAALIEAFHDGVRTTGAAPLALLVDNRPSNHTDDVQAALGDTLRIHATRGRPQNDAHVEGAFGLFQQTVPPLHIEGHTPRELARHSLSRIIQTWARTLNHRPRHDRDRRSRVQLYTERLPSDDEIEHAHQALEERLRRQERARRTRQARLDPIVRATLDDAFTHLALNDPEGHIRSAIARYPLDAILAGIATFEIKQRRATLPEGADARYLLGIVRNIAHEDEGWAITDAHWKARLKLRDAVLLELEAQRCAQAHALPEPERLLKASVDHALATSRQLDRYFWLTAAADLIAAQPPATHTPLFRLAARRIHATHRVTHRQRLAATRFLAAKLAPLA